TTKTNWSRSTASGFSRNGRSTTKVVMNGHTRAARIPPGSSAEPELIELVSGYHAVVPRTSMLFLEPVSVVALFLEKQYNSGGAAVIRVFCMKPANAFTLQGVQDNIHVVGIHLH